MAASPQWKIYDAEGDYEASCKSPVIAAAIVGVLGEGARVKYAHRVPVWREGAEEFLAADSYDSAAEVMMRRMGRYPDGSRRP